tara:strand:- start:442 stop:2844 length:2403 start_codon:yes stop_codon:yes gene_type:complete
MSLTLPSAFTTKTILKTNWLVELYFDSEGEDDFRGLSFYDTRVEGTDTVDYKGCILNKPTIRESINLEDSTAKTSNVSLTLANFIDNDGQKFSRKLLNGSNNYLNRSVKIYIQPDDTNDRSDCLLIYTGRLTTISQTTDKISINIVAQRAWDNISIPTTRTATNIPVPVVYGNYTNNAQNTFQDAITVYPMPKLRTDGDDIYYATPKSYGSGCFPHYYDDNIKKFIIMGQYAHGTTTLDSDNAVVVDNRLNRGVYLLRPTKVKDHTDWDGSNPENSIDTNTTSSTTQNIAFSVSGIGGTNVVRKTLKLSMPQIKGQFSSLKLQLKASVVINTASYNTGGQSIISLSDTTFANDTSDPNNLGTAYISKNQTASTGTYNTSGAGDSSSYTEINLFDKYERKTDSGRDLDGAISATDSIIKIDSSSDDFKSGTIIKIDDELMHIVNRFPLTTLFIVERGYSYSTSATHSDNTDIFIISEGSYTLPTEINIQALVFALSASGSGSISLDVDFILKDFYLVIGVENATAREPQATQESIEQTNLLYSSGDGLTETYSGSNGDAFEIHKQHRDLMKRFTNYTGTPTGWSDLDSARNWQSRYWILESTPLIDHLEKLQYEGGFIARFNGQNEFQYIFIANSPSVTATLDGEDISDINISTVDFFSLVSKMDIEYELHPAESKYNTSVTSTNSNTRTRYNIQSAENTKNIKLDAYVSPTIPSSASSNKNDDFYSYYNHIVGSPRTIINFTVVNPNYFGLDVGDVIAFDGQNNFDDVLMVFATSWDDFNFMITDVSRSVGSLKITAREI